MSIDVNKLIEKYPNDQELGAAVRKEFNNNITCCDKPENLGSYLDYEGVVFPQCKVCGKIL